MTPPNTALKRIATVVVLSAVVGSGIATLWRGASRTSTTSTKQPFAGEQIDVPVTVKFPDDAGPFSTTVLLKTDKGLGKLTIRGELIRPLPKQIDLGAVLRGQMVARSFDFRWLPDARSVTATRYDHAKYDLITTVLPDGNGLNCRILLRPQQHAGAVEDTIEFTTDDPAATKWTTRVKGKVLAPVELMESEIAVGRLRRGQTAQTVVRLFSPYGRPLSVRNVKFLPEDGGEVQPFSVTPASEVGVPITVRFVPGERVIKLGIMFDVFDGVEESKVAASLFALGE